MLSAILHPKKEQLSLLVAACLVLALFATSVPVVIGQGGGGAITVDLIYQPEHLILTLGEEGEWDSGWVNDATVLYQDDLFHMFYLGSKNIDTRASYVGYATSEDGLTWSKYEDNPVFVPDESQAAYGVGAMAPYFDGETWVLYFAPRVRLGFGATWTVMRATAPDPTGPWTVDEAPLLELGEGRAWDNRTILPDSVVATDDGLALYYTGAGSSSAVVGLATSSDGLTWAKYDDPETTTPQLNAGDPVFETGERDSWDESYVVAPYVRAGAAGWEMFYEGQQQNLQVDIIFPGIGYATSEDGIQWERYSENPLLASDESHFPASPSVVVVDDIYYLYYTMFTLELEAPAGFGVATGTITHGEE